MDETMALGRLGLALRSLKEEISGVYEQVKYKAEKSSSAPC